MYLLITVELSITHDFQDATRYFDLVFWNHSCLKNISNKKKKPKAKAKYTFDACDSWANLFSNKTSTLPRLHRHFSTWWRWQCTLVQGLDSDRTRGRRLFFMTVVKFCSLITCSTRNLRSPPLPLSFWKVCFCIIWDRIRRGERGERRILASWIQFIGFATKCDLER